MNLSAAIGGGATGAGFLGRSTNWYTASPVAITNSTTSANRANELRRGGWSDAPITGITTGAGGITGGAPRSGTGWLVWCASTPQVMSATALSSSTAGSSGPVPRLSRGGAWGIDGRVGASSGGSGRWVTADSELRDSGNGNARDTALDDTLGSDVREPHGSSVVAMRARHSATSRAENRTPA